VLGGNATPRLLDTYEEERLPVASWLLAITSEVLDVVLAAIKEKGGGVDAGAAKELTQLLLRYPWSRLSRQASDRATGPQAGDRAPDAPLRLAGSGTPTRLFDLFRGPHFTLLGLGEHRPVDGADLNIESDLVSSYRVVGGGLGAPGNRGAPDNLTDHDGHVAGAYGTDDALILVRPDGYIGLIAHPTQLDSVREYLRAL
jgi:hypothetical protein